jgi:hypothetical protein
MNSNSRACILSFGDLKNVNKSTAKAKAHPSIIKTSNKTRIKRFEKDMLNFSNRCVL